MKTAAEYLACVKGWHAPWSFVVIRKYDGVYVVRDDLLGVGSKVRFLDALMFFHPEVKEWVYGSSPRVGFAQISLACICQRYGKGCTIFIAKANELHPNTKIAQKFGATIVEVPMGFLAVTEARAREYVKNRPGASLLPIGLAHDVIYGAIIKVARALPCATPDEVWTAAGSGTLNRGLQLAWPKAKCFMVAVGHEITKEEAGRATVIRESLKFAQPCSKADLPPFPSCINYDAKAWKHIPKNQGKKKMVLFWNVA